ncbi:TadE/TadG family type IV pilus assembly protein [Terrihabitans sp. B22-R8]|uniref:TadE/TadG family type IV pilus assembly protein n=1 Tax=Terrihabitans sp. B22-R8 TaxID=3425128 RepID=UPI00403D4880
MSGGQASRSSVTGRLRRDRRGASAVEFALIAPLMLFMLLGTFEITRALSARAKLHEMTETVYRFTADANAQSEQNLRDDYVPPVTRADLGRFVDRSSAVLFPFARDRSVLSVVIQRIDRKDGGGAVVWSYDWNTQQGSRPAKQTSDLVPSEESRSLIRVQASYRQKSMFSTFLAIFGFSDLRLSSESFGVMLTGKALDASF